MWTRPSYDGVYAALEQFRTVPQRQADAIICHSTKGHERSRMA